jgi:transcriptional regulator with XRE-family HTH domain
MERFGEVAGEVLRDARRKRGLTLRAVWRRSGGRFKPSALGGYERGERSISLDKFCGLAAIYGVAADRLLAEVLDRVTPGGRRRVDVDLDALADLGQAEVPKSDDAQAVGQFVHSIRTRRGDFLTNVVSLRAGDLESFATELGVEPKTLVKRLEPALHDSGASDATGLGEAEHAETRVLRQ